MFTTLRSKPESARQWYVRIATACALFLIIIFYILMRIHTQTGSWRTGIAHIRDIGRYGVGAFSHRLEDIRAPLRPIPTSTPVDTRPSFKSEEKADSPEFKDVADI
jgi:hypothetical protein